MSNHTFDLYKIQSATQRAKEYADDTISRTKRYLVEDEDKDRRIAEGFCKWCWYRRRGSLAGQAFTEYTCHRCDQNLMHPNTGVPVLCPACAKETALCCSCCGDIHGAMRKEIP